MHDSSSFVFASHLFTTSRIESNQTKPNGVIFRKENVKYENPSSKWWHKQKYDTICLLLVLVFVSSSFWWMKLFVPNRWTCYSTKGHTSLGTTRRRKEDGQKNTK